MRRIKWILTVAAVMAALTVLAAPVGAQDLDDDSQDLDDDCIFADGDTFCDVNEVSAVYDFGDCFFTDNDLFCRVIRFDGVADNFGLFGFGAVDRVDFDLRDVDLDDDLDLNGGILIGGTGGSFDIDGIDLDDDDRNVQRLVSIDSEFDRFEADGFEINR